MGTNTYTKIKSSGAAVPLVLVAVVVLVVMGTAMLGVAMHTRLMSSRSASDLVARSAADAGLVKVLYEMNERLKVGSWDNSFLPAVTGVQLENCDATYDYTVTGNPTTGFTVEAVGRAGRSVKRTSCTLDLAGPFDAAIFAKQNLILNNSAAVDWYNNDGDDYSFQVGTNSTLDNAISLKSGITINGDVVVGPGANPDTVINGKSTANITGSTYALTTPCPFSPVIVPPDLQFLPSSGVITDTGTITSSAKYSEIDLRNNNTITISGSVDLYITGNITLGNSSQLLVDNSTNPNASLTLYVGGYFEGKNNSDINNLTADSTKLKIYGLDTCSNIDIKNNSSFYGAIYAPEADVVFHNAVDIYGAVAAENIEQKNSANFNYDASLRDISMSDTSVRFVIDGWSEQ
jgi:hypothetical protein